MAYKRQIAYFDLIEFGEKKGSGGFCKWEQKNGVHILEISICGLDHMKGKTVKIFTRAGHELEELHIKDGRAFACLKKKATEGKTEWEFSKIRIPLLEDKELVAEFEVDVVDLPEREIKENDLRETTQRNEEDNLRKEGQEENELEMEEELPLYSLWNCVTKTHEILHPFGTETEYCKIGLEDIFLLKEKYHILRKNQFLFHGYYNYKYLILGKKEEGGEEYWLGVPGIYHEREKMAARMYGFEKFEGTKPRYGVGDLGYYLITVE